MPTCVCHYCTHVCTACCCAACAAMPKRFMYMHLALPAVISGAKSYVQCICNCLSHNSALHDCYVVSNCVDLIRFTDVIITTDFIRITAFDYSIEALMRAVRHTLTNLSMRVRGLNKRRSTCQWASLAKTQPGKLPCLLCQQV